MASSTQCYRYNGMVVEVRRTVDLDGGKSRFQCLVRGYGHGNPAPRKKYTVEAETNAQASRIAFQMYNVDIDKDGKTDKKVSRKDKYRAIMDKDGIRFEDCRVLAFTFERPLGPETFHLHLMNADPRPEYYLFDCWGMTAQIIIPNDEPTAARVQELAEQMGGKTTTPNLI